MITTLDIIEDIIKLLYKASLDKLITGSIAPNRPINSESEDIIVRTLPLSHGMLQSCVALINIHVPNLKRNENGLVTFDTPNRPRLNELAELVNDAVNEKITSNIYTRVLFCNLFQEKYSSFVGFRIDVKGKNLR